MPGESDWQVTIIREDGHLPLWASCRAQEADATGGSVTLEGSSDDGLPGCSAHCPTNSAPHSSRASRRSLTWGENPICSASVIWISAQGGRDGYRKGISAPRFRKAGGSITSETPLWRGVIVPAEVALGFPPRRRWLAQGQNEEDLAR